MHRPAYTIASLIDGNEKPGRMVHGEADRMVHGEADRMVHGEADRMVHGEADAAGRRMRRRHRNGN